MSRTVQIEWHQTHGNHLFDVFYAIPPIPLVITTSPFSPIKVPPTSCIPHKWYVHFLPTGMKFNSLTIENVLHSVSLVNVYRSYKIPTGLSFECVCEVLRFALVHNDVDGAFDFSHTEM